MTKANWLILVATLSAGVAAGCEDDGGESDAGSQEIRDAGGRGDDAGSAGEDAGMVADAGGEEDAGPRPGDGGAEEDSGPTGPAHCEATDLILEVVDPDVGITVFNPTSSDITIDGSTYVLCQRPQYRTLAALESGVTVSAGGRHTFDWPATFPDDDAGGELALYRDSAYESGSSLLDFVCWGTGHNTVSRQNVAEGSGQWSGGCAGAITGASLRRIPGTDGTDAASYDPTGTADALSCP